MCSSINLVRPLGLALREVTGLQKVTTSWGETYTVATAVTDGTKTLVQAERDLITEALVATGGQVGGAGGGGAILEINPNTLRSRMRKLGVSAKDLASSSFGQA